MPQPTKKEIVEAIEEGQTIIREELELTDVEGDEDIKPPLTELVDLTPEEIERARKECFSLIDLMKDDRKEIDKELDGLDAQYKGDIVEEDQMEFSLNVDITKVKCDTVERLAIKSFLDSDPMFVSTLRPESVRDGMTNDEADKIARDQSDYLDYVLDERINIASPLRKVIHQATVLKGGLMKIPYSYKRKRRVREEFYSGKQVDTGKVDEQRSPIYMAEGMEGFLKNYPTAIVEGEKGHKYFKRLVEGKDAKFEADYWAVVQDDVKPVFVSTKDFICRKSVEGYDGLCEEQLYAERVRYTFWDLKKMEDEDKIIDVDKMKFNTEKLDETDQQYEIKEHNVLEITYWFKFDNDEEETRMVLRFGEDNKVFLGAYNYPYHVVDCVYIPFYITDKVSGWYKNGLAESLTDNNMAQNSLLNMMLTEAWLELVTTPIVRETSSLAGQLLGKNFKAGVPLTIGAQDNLAEEIAYFPKSQKPAAANMLPVLLFLSKLGGDATGVSDISSSGKSDPLDPRAPAAKTAMLLKQSGINIEEYINCLLPSFNKVGELILKITYQMSNSGRKFRGKQRAGKVTGGNVFEELSRDDMILETVIQSRAGAFAFDKISEKQENLTIYQLLRQEPILARNPKAVREMAISLLESWSPMWKAKAEKLLLTNEEYNQEVMKVGLHALNTYMKGLQEQAQATGTMPQPDLQQYMSVVAELMSAAVNPTEEEQEQSKKG